MNTAPRREKATFSPKIYDIGSIEEAKGVILGPEPHETVDQRWERETPYLGDLMQAELGLTKDSVLLDYGCGIGRMSWELIRRTGCRAVGIDYSTNMRAFAANYTDTPNFMCCDATMLDVFKPQMFDAAISVWVLQHVLRPLDAILQIKDALKPGGLFFVVNELRLVPTDKGFVNDSLDVTAMLDDNFYLVKTIKMDVSIGVHLAPRTYCAVYQK